MAQGVGEQEGFGRGLDDRSPSLRRSAEGPVGNDVVSFPASQARTLSREALLTLISARFIVVQRPVVREITWSRLNRT